MDTLNFVSQYAPEFLLRAGIRRLCQQRLDEEKVHYRDQQHEATFVEQLRESPIALSTNEANNQHYQVPTEFFQIVLGKRLKYSCCWWDEQTESLDDAEEQMLNLYCERAKLKDGMRVLELGCGWGSLSLYLAERFPNMKITAMSNSNTQREYITQQASKHSFANLTPVTQDINTFDTDERYDAVISIEMFEHVRNYQTLLKRIESWLNPGGVCFVHHFCHKEYTYPFAMTDKNNWMTQYFFTNGLMPSQHLLEHFVDQLSVADQWAVNGMHYQRTLEAWLDNHKAHKEKIIDLFTKNSSRAKAKLQWKHWQIFFLACSELFAYHGGNEWFVQHYLLKKA